MQCEDGDYCDGTFTPPWEAHLNVKLLWPGLLMSDLLTQCRTVVLASGSISPLQSLCAELDLQGAETSKSGRLQTKPMPLEANHGKKRQHSVTLIHFLSSHFPAFKRGSNQFAETAAFNSSGQLSGWLPNHSELQQLQTSRFYASPGICYCQHHRVHPFRWMSCFLSLLFLAQQMRQMLESV